MKVLVTGSSGLLGRMLINYLITNGINIVGVDIRESPEYFPSDHFRFHLCSVTDREKLRSVFSEEKPTNVVHFACSFNKVRDRDREYEIDIGGSENVLAVSEETLSVKQLLFSSSAAAYGGNRDNKIWLKESDPLRPGRYRYGINKKLVENCYGCKPGREDLRIASLRICTVIGPSFDKPRTVASILIRYPWLPAACRENRIQFLHTDDLVSLLRLILNDNEIDGVYNIAPDSYSVIGELVPWKKYRNIPLSLISGALWIFWNLKVLNLQPAAVKNAIYPIVIDPSKIISRYGYKFRYSSDEAFADTMVNNSIPSGAWM